MKEYLQNCRKLIEHFAFEFKSVNKGGFTFFMVMLSSEHLIAHSAFLTYRFAGGHEGAGAMLLFTPNRLQRRVTDDSGIPLAGVTIHV